MTFHMQAASLNGSGIQLTYRLIKKRQHCRLYDYLTLLNIISWNYHISQA